MGLIDELKADQHRSATCLVCAWLATRPPAEQTEWDIAFKDKSFTTRSLLRAAQKRGYHRGEKTITRHRAGHPIGKP